MRLPTPSFRTQKLSMAGLHAGVALMALVSLHPYLLWSHQKPAYAIATLIVTTSCAGCFPALVLTRERVLFSIGFSLFLIYLSVLPKAHGGVTRWFFLIPFTMAVLHLRREDLQAAFDKFHWLFVLSLLPGMLLWVWIVAGLPVELRYTTPPADIIQRGATEYLELPGAVFLFSNALVLPHGGVLFRLCGMYDEPGTVGTIAALCLAATRFRLWSVKGVISFAAGMMSLSIAFAVLTVAGLVATAISARRPRLLPAALIVALAGLLPLTGVTFGDRNVANLSVVVPSDVAATLPAAPAEGSGQRFVPAPEWRLRNTPGFDSRTQPWMRKLLEDYRAAPTGALLFGIASDASLVHGWGSSVWYRLLTDFGIVGFVWVFALFSWPLVQLWRGGQLDVAVMIFCTLFLMSFYQRPIIWLPAQLLIYFAGLQMKHPR
jgi:hypothetical protein